MNGVGTMKAKVARSSKAGGNSSGAGKRKRVQQRQKLPDNPLYELRKRNLKKLIDDRYEGNTAAFARAVKRAESYVWQMLHGHRKMGETMARYLEQRLNMKPMTLDTGEATYAPTRTLIVHTGTGEIENYHMVPRVSLEDINKQLNGSLIPCPLGCSEDTVYFLLDTDELQPRARLGERGFVDRQQVDPIHGKLYAVRTKKSAGYCVVMLCKKGADHQHRFYEPCDESKPGIELKSLVEICGRITGWHRDD